MAGRHIDRIDLLEAIVNNDAVLVDRLGHHIGATHLQQVAHLEVAGFLDGHRR